ncbi:MAG: hypothetical protein R3Y64_01455 [Peptostreptococcaceae bacterium]
MILANLEDLDKYKNSLNSKKDLIINNTNLVGECTKNSYNNKLFFWNFDSLDLKNLVKVFEEFRDKELKVNGFKIKIKNIANDMISKNVCPIEAILYASKSVNSLLEENNILLDSLSDIIKEVYFIDEKKYKQTIEFILKEWTYKNQLRIVISSCGKIKDLDLIDLIYELHSETDNKFICLKCFMNIFDEKTMDYSLSLISRNNEFDSTEVEMSKYFINQYKNRFGQIGIKKAEKYILDENINKQSRKVISRAIPNTEKIESITLNLMIKKAKNWENEENFEEVFLEWMQDTKTRKDAFLSIRYSNCKNVENMICYIIENYDCNSIEIGTALITIAQWASRMGISENFFEMINKYKMDESKIMYCNAAMCSIGYESESIELIKDYLEEEIYNHRHIFSIIRDCSYKSSKLLRRSVRNVYREYFSSNDEVKIQKALNGAFELCYKPKFNFKDIVMFEIKRLVINKKMLSDEIYLSTINLIDRILNDKNKDDFLDILFFIIENDSIGSEIKNKAVLLLKRLKVNPPN